MSTEPKFTDAPCQHCGSPKRVVNPAWLRSRRERAEVTLREMGRRLGYSAVYLSDIERGRRNARPNVVQAYEAL